MRPLQAFACVALLGAFAWLAHPHVLGPDAEAHLLAGRETILGGARKIDTGDLHPVRRRQGPGQELVGLVQPA